MKPLRTKFIKMTDLVTILKGVWTPETEFYWRLPLDVIFFEMRENCRKNP